MISKETWCQIEAEMSKLLLTGPRHRQHLWRDAFRQQKALCVTSPVSRVLGQSHTSDEMMESCKEGSFDRNRRASAVSREHQADERGGDWNLDTAC